MSSSVDIIIVNWNSGTQLRQCLLSLEGEARSVHLQRVVVVDNNSGDDSLKGIEDLPLPLTIIRNSNNVGFATACNQAAEDSQADQLLFLNPDTRVFSGALSRAIACLEDGSGRGVGIVGVQLVDEGGHPHPSCVRFPTLGRLVNEMLGLSQLFPKRFSGLFMRDWDHRASREVDHVMGAFTLIKTGLFKSLQGFDEGFFMYLEDLDLSLRARQMGWRSFYMAEACVYHKSGGTSEQAKARRLFYLLRSRFRYASKHMGAARTALIVGITFTLELVLRVVEALARGQWSRVSDTLEGYLLLTRDIVRGGR